MISIWSHDWDLNPGPLPYHGSALPLSYRGIFDARHRRREHRAIIEFTGYALPLISRGVNPGQLYQIPPLKPSMLAYAMLWTIT